jgi:serine/threonine-protein kinase HipA
MASRPALDVWLYDTLVGSLAEPQYGKLRFGFTEEAERRFRPGSVVLSTSMPINAQRRPRSDIARAFFNGVLPEGEPRDRLSEGFAVRRGDAFGLLSAIARDCAGAVVLQPAGGPVPGSADRVDPLADHDLERLIARLRERPLGADDEVRVSLPGVQDKLLLAKTPDGAWGRPVAGAPSTHILKPQDMRLDSYAAAEAFCLHLAAHLGLTDVDTEVIDVDGRPVIVVSRYDRRRTPSGVVRIHQEDACQALGVDCSERPYRKYESGGGPSLRSFAAVLAGYAGPGDRAKLLALTILNVTIGNADAHAKNLSIVHLPDGTTALAPAYDLTPTTFYKDVPTPEGPKDLSDKLGMWVNGKRVMQDVTAEDLAAEGASWGLPRAEADQVVQTTLGRISELIDVAAREAPLPAAVIDFVAGATVALSAGRRRG